jgi:hypothetical protein
MQNTESKVLEGPLTDQIREMVLPWTSDEVRSCLDFIRVTNVFSNRLRIDFFCKVHDENSELMFPQRKILDSRFCHLESRSDDTLELVDVTVKSEPKQNGGLW